LTIPNPEHLFEQAKRLIERQASGAPRQVDIRRAISAAYYAVFHFALREVADEFVGKGQQTSAAYALAYRSLSHKKLADICKEVKKPELKASLKKYAPEAGYSWHIREFSELVVQLQEKRHEADYNPSPKFRLADARADIAAAEAAIERFSLADPEEKRVFLALLVFQAR
jgi:hypothetical protein